MSENKQHPYAEILRAIADGKQIQSKLEGEWVDRSYPMALQDISLNRIDRDSIRVKPKTIRIGEFDVPEPLRVAPEIGTEYWVMDLREAFGSFWEDHALDFDRLSQGRIHLSEESAELHAKALISLAAQK